MLVGVDFIKKEEGLRLTAYQDQGGKWTIGYGSTGPGIEAGVTWPEQQAEERLESDVADVQAHVKKVVKVPISNNQLAALTSFTYNLGKSNLDRSGLLKLLNRLNYAGAADQFLLWCHVGLFKSQALLARRNRERTLFLTKD